MKTKSPLTYCGLILLILSVSVTGCFTNPQKAFQKEITVPTDTLYLDNTRDTLITGPKGTALFFPKEAFVFSDGTVPRGKITIQLKECFSPSEMIRENLSTMSGNQVLETRGMVYVAAFSDNKELQIKNGKSYIIHFPKDTTEKGKLMNLYYGKADENDNVKWDIDTQSLLKPMAHIEGTSWTNSCGSVEEHDFFRFRDDTTMNVYSFFNKTFDDKKLTLGDKLLNKHFCFSFKKTQNGDLKDKKVMEVDDKFFSTESVKDPEIDNYIALFFHSIPALIPPACTDSPNQGSIWIRFDYKPAYKDREDYDSLFNQKYAVFKNQAIKTMNEAELNYYVFSASKLGWINCDYFWKTKDEKIDYIVKVDPASKPNVKIIFKEAKSIMTGSLEGDKYIFRNVPINKEIKIVAIQFKGSKPMLSIAETKTGRQVFDAFQYKDFTLTDLEKQLNTP